MCWICLGDHNEEHDALLRPCKCPRWVSVASPALASKKKYPKTKNTFSRDLASARGVNGVTFFFRLARAAHCAEDKTTRLPSLRFPLPFPPARASFLILHLDSHTRRRTHHAESKKFLWETSFHTKLQAFPRRKQKHLRSRTPTPLPLPLP